MTASAPSQTAQAHSQKLQRLIQEKIQADGPIKFSTFMQMALYQPGLGYYQAGSHKLGEGGDFTTAPEISPLFSYCLGQQCQAILATLPEKNILELGAGTGKMAADILHFLNQQHALPTHYYILEISPDLKKRQQDYLEHQCNMLPCEIVWLDTLPDNFVGAVLANEVLDAMPVDVFRWSGDLLTEAYVTYEKNHFTWSLNAPSTAMLEAFDLIQCNVDLNAWELPYCSEINVSITPWIKALAHSIKQGAVLLIDYGYTRTEYYRPDRSMGTLMAHYQHHAHSDPFFFPGLQDLTAHVDFTKVIESADAAGFDLAGFTNQAHFLINLGITGYLEAITDDITLSRATQAVKTLTSPNSMGETFKVMALGKNLDCELTGFKTGDLSDRL